MGQTLTLTEPRSVAQIKEDLSGRSVFNSPGSIRRQSLILTLVFLGLFSDRVSTSSLSLACLRFSVLKKLRAPLIISIVSPCDAVVVCEAVIVYEHWHLSRVENSLDFIALLPFEIPSQLQLQRVVVSRSQDSRI